MFRSQCGGVYKYNQKQYQRGIKCGKSFITNWSLKIDPSGSKKLKTLLIYIMNICCSIGMVDIKTKGFTILHLKNLHFHYMLYTVFVYILIGWIEYAFSFLSDPKPLEPLESTSTHNDCYCKKINHICILLVTTNLSSIFIWCKTSTSN